MNQKHGRIEPLSDTQQVFLNERLQDAVNRLGKTLTAKESALTEIAVVGWPTIALHEVVSVKGVWFRVTYLKPGSGNIRLQMLNESECCEEGKKIIRPTTGDVLAAIQEEAEGRK